MNDDFGMLLLFILWSLICFSFGGLLFETSGTFVELCPLVVENKTLCSIDSSSNAVLNYVKMERGLLNE